MSDSNQAIAKALSPEDKAKIMLSGNLAGLDDVVRWQYYQDYCAYLGLDPITRPFDLLTTREEGPNGQWIEKTILYANAGCSAQLADKRQVTYSEPVAEFDAALGVFTVKVQASFVGGGRSVWRRGVAAIDGLKGRRLENAIKKAETQAHRRATLALCGVAMPDESEIEDIAGAEARPITPAKLPPITIDEAIPTAHELFDAPRPLPDAPLPVAWVDDSPARIIADQTIANEINKGLQKIAEEVEAEAPKPPEPAPDNQTLGGARADEMTKRIEEARNKNIMPPTKPTPAQAPARKPVTPNRGPVARNHSKDTGERLDKIVQALTARGITGRELLEEVNNHLREKGKPQVATRYALDEQSAVEVCEVFEVYREAIDRKSREALGKS